MCETNMYEAGQRRPETIGEGAPQNGDAASNMKEGRHKARRGLPEGRGALRFKSGWRTSILAALLAASLAPGAWSFCLRSNPTATPAFPFRASVGGRWIGSFRVAARSLHTCMSVQPTRDDAEKEVRGRGLKRSRGRAPLDSAQGGSTVRDASIDEEEYVGSWGSDTGMENRLATDEDWTMWLNRGFPSMLNTMTAFRDVRASARKAAVTALLKGIADYPAGPTAPWMVDALVGRMEDDSACVREAAVRGLVKVSERGNEAVVIAMAYLIEEETAVTVKKAALQALPRLANRGDEKALAPVMKLLECVQGHERGDIFCPHVSRMLSKHAVKALGTLAGRGNEEVLKVLHGRILDDPEPSVREAAARSIGNLADADDARSVAALYLCMEDEDEVVRRTAMRSTRTMLRRQREDRVRSGGAEEPEDEPECGASRLWLLPGMWGG